jgi:hypothetical protein
VTPVEVRIQPIVADLVRPGRVIGLGRDASYSLAQRNERSPHYDEKAKAQHRHKELLDLDATGPHTLDASARMGE